MKPKAPMPIDPPKTPDLPTPAGACDTHIHMIADEPRFPTWENRVEDPSPGTLEDWVARYRRVQETLGFARTVVVHSIIFGADNAVTLAGVAALGRETTRGIGLVENGASDEALDALSAAGVVGVRLNYVHGGVLTFDGVEAMASRLAARGMHVQMLMNAHKHMAELASRVRALPVPVVFDHIGWPDIAAGVDEPGFKALCDLLADGQCWVKLSGIYRLVPKGDAARPYAGADAAVSALIAANTDRCLWGSDWPYLMLGDAESADPGGLLDAFNRVAGTDATRRRILVDNPVALYGF